PVPQQPRRRREAVSDRTRGERPQVLTCYARRSNSDANVGRSEVRAAQEAAHSASNIPLAKRLAILGGVCSGLLGLAAVNVLSGPPKVQLVTANGSAYFMQAPEAYATTAARTMDGSVLNKNKLTIDTGKISQELARNYPEIKTATVVLPLVGTQPTVYIEPYRPSFILITTSSSAYLLDENGRALVSTSQITDTGELSVPTVQDKSGLAVKLGDQVLARATVGFVEQVLAVLESQDVEISSLVLPPGSSEVDIAIAGKPYVGKFNLQGDARLQAGTFMATKRKLEAAKVTPGQYIDVRVPERAYIR
ncbi:MAG TPA: hypothetical protein VK978_03530, partial [Candidatus Saccharimonadales bacterium]|nr:hypothetical protein [Candidatus Saccharimonadales bacterium]